MDSSIGKTKLTNETGTPMKYAELSKQYINGAWVEGHSNTVYQDVNPYNQQVLAQIRLADKSDIDAAYVAASKAQPAWAKVPAAEKRAIIQKAMDWLAANQEACIQLLIAETGSTFPKAQVEVMATIGTLAHSLSFPDKMATTTHASFLPGKENTVVHLPLGVVGVVSPWNFPLVLSARSVAAAIATGNAVVLKPDSQSLMSGGSILVAAFAAAGLPAGVLNMVVADLNEVGDAFIEHPIPRLISFTGSTRAGQHVHRVANEHMKKTILELGGNNVMIVLGDADVNQAAAAAAFGRFLHQGQICLSVNRMVVDRKIYPEFVRLLKAKVQMMKVGNPAEPDTFIGPLINHTQAEKVKALIEQSVKEGATIELQGKIEGNLVYPYILTNVTQDMAVAKNEIFGPVAPVLAFDSEQEAIDIANSTPFGLSGSVFSGSIDHGLAVAHQIHTGMIHVNDQSVNEEPHMPFGGEKCSGSGRFGGDWVFEEFTTVKWISIQREPRGFPF